MCLNMYSVEFVLTCESFMLWQALLRSDLPFYMVPFATGDLAFKKPEVCAVTIRLIFLYSRLLFPDIFVFFFFPSKVSFGPKGNLPFPLPLAQNLLDKKRKKKKKKSLSQNIDLAI